MCNLVDKPLLAAVCTFNLKMTKVTLVRRGGKLYPRKSDDYELLAKLGYPMYSVDTSYLVLLKAVLRSSKVKVEELSFEDVFSQLVDKLNAKFKHGIVQSKSSLTFIAPSTYNTSKLESLTRALAPWFRAYGLTLEHTQKTTKNSIRLVITLSEANDE